MEHSTESAADAAFLRALASRMSYHASPIEAEQKHRLYEIAVRIETNYYAAPPPGAPEPDAQTRAYMLAGPAPLLKAALAAPLAQPEPPAGWQIVPKVPTQEMCQQGQWKANEWPKFPLRISPIYQAMLAAAPVPAPAEIAEGVLRAMNETGQGEHGFVDSAQALRGGRCGGPTGESER
jgi:hypothetical protein